MEPKSTFRITRVDLDLDAARIIAEALVIGSSSSCYLLLNHPAVAGIQAIIKRVGTVFHIRNCEPSYLLTINGKAIGDDLQLNTGDRPFHYQDNLHK